MSFATRCASMFRRWAPSFAGALLAACCAASALAGPRPPDPLDAGQTRIALEKLRVVGSVLYVAAHPDDENTAMLAWFARERKVRTAYLSMTRGDGGQNLIGNELGAELGVIRTQELLAARHVDGAEQFFTRARRLWLLQEPRGDVRVLGPRLDPRRRRARHPALPARRDRHALSRPTAAAATATTPRRRSWPRRRSAWRPTRSAFPEQFALGVRRGRRSG